MLFDFPDDDYSRPRLLQSGAFDPFDVSIPSHIVASCTATSMDIRTARWYEKTWSIVKQLWVNIRYELDRLDNA